MDSRLVSRTGDIATVTLNHPARLNALDTSMWEGRAVTTADYREGVAALPGRRKPRFTGR